MRRGALVAALTDPFNVVLFGALLVAGALLGTVRLMVPLALAVYAAAVWRSYQDFKEEHPCVDACSSSASRSPPWPSPSSPPRGGDPSSRLGDRDAAADGAPRERAAR